MYAVCPEIDIAGAGKVASGPFFEVLLPLLLQPHHRACRQAFRVLAKDGLKRFCEITRGDPFQIKDGDKVVEGRDTAHVAGEYGAGEGFALSFVPYPGLFD